jgi:hypothetical protein
VTALRAAGGQVVERLGDAAIDGSLGAGGDQADLAALAAGCAEWQRDAIEEPGDLVVRVAVSPCAAAASWRI